MRDYGWSNAAPRLATGVLLLLAFWPHAHLNAQTMLGDVTGLVADPSGAGIPRAAVTVTNEGTHAKRAALTDTSGTYRIDGLLVGTYTIEVEAVGFKKYVQTGVAVTPAALKRVDASLAVGDIKETVEVSGVAPVIQTESPALTTGLPSVAYGSKPVTNESRRGYIFDPLMWAPGSASGQAIYSFAGNRPSMEQTNVEGVQEYQYWLYPPTTSVQEVNVIMSNAPAEYARPVTMDATFKSGTNRLSGEWYQNFVNSCANAKSTPFSNPSHTPCPPTWRRFATVSGPVFLPKVYDGRNKTFFFFTYNWSNFAAATPITQSVPTLAMQRGDFSAYPRTILDPTTQQPFVGNTIPAGRISPFAKGVIADYYGPAYQYVGGPNSYVNNAQLISPTTVNEHFYVMKFDHNLGNSDVFSGSYMHQDQIQGNGRSGSAPAASGETRLSSRSVQSLPGLIVALAETHTFSPTIVNQFRAGATRAKLSVFQANSDWQPVKGADVASGWGLQGLPPLDLSGSPDFLITNWNFLTPDNASLSVDTRYSAYDNMSIHRGRHTVKVGYSATKLLSDGTATGPYFGNFNFNGQFTSEPWADFVLGYPSTFQRYVPRATIARRGWEHGAFAQDDFKLTTNFTIFYGLRWDKFKVPYDKNGLYYNFDPSTFSVVVPNDFARQHVSPAWPSQIFPIKTAQEAAFPSRLLSGTSNFLPRFGFAYQFRKNLVLRGGYGLFTGALRFNQLQTTGPFAITENFINTVDPTAASGAVYVFPTPFPSTSGTATVASITGFARNYRTPYSQNWNLSLEQEILKNWGLRMTYRGVKTTQMLWQQDLNAVPASSVPFIQSRRPHPGLQNINFIQNGANDHYDAMMFQVTHPWVAGIYFTGSYTYQRSGTEAPGGPFDIDQTAGAPEYSFDRARDAGRHVAYPTHDFIANFVDDLPFGRGRRFAPNTNRLVNALIGDWSLSGAFSYRSGWFYTPTLQGVDPGNIGSTSGRRPALVPGCDTSASQNVHGLWFNPQCFAVPPAGQLGDLTVNSLDGPSAWVLNLSPYKDFPLNFIREGSRFRFGAFIYNILNHPTYAIPTTNLNSLVAGRITRTDYARGFSHEYTGQRQFIFDMRFIF